MVPDDSGWISAKDAVVRYRIPYNSLRSLVNAGVLTRGRFSAASGRPPIYVRVEELDAWQRGGVSAVAPIKAAFDASQGVTPAPAGA